MRWKVLHNLKYINSIYCHFFFLKQIASQVRFHTLSTMFHNDVHPNDTCQMCTRYNDTWKELH